MIIFSLTREQSLALADAAIAQGLSVDTQTAIACVSEAGTEL